MYSVTLESGELTDISNVVNINSAIACIQEWTIENGMSCEFRFYWTDANRLGRWPTLQYDFYKKADATAFKLKWA